jgi:hypothetical protein
MRFLSAGNHMAARMKTSHTAINRLLDQEGQILTIETISRAARAELSRREDGTVGVSRNWEAARPISRGVVNQRGRGGLVRVRRNCRRADRGWSHRHQARIGVHAGGRFADRCGIDLEVSAYSGAYG